MVSFEFTMLAIICLGNTDATTVPRLKDSPAKNVFTTVGKTIELKWTFEVNLTEYPDASLQFLQPSDRLLYYVEIAANQIHPSKVLNGIPFLNRITWTGNVADNSASFTFSNVTRDLSLTYFLALLFSGHQSTEPVILDVLEPPTFVVKKTHQEKVIREGKNLTENCTTVWQLPMTVKWIKDGFSLFNGTNSSNLNIKAINRSQSGIYSCEGTNNVATIRRWINVSVLYPVTIKRLLYSTRKSFIGQSATFQCFSDGYPKPVYEWKTPNPNGRHNSSREDNSSILNVEFVSSADFGNYTCSVKNSISNSSQTVPVTQLFRPNKISSITYDRRPFGVLLLWNKTDWDGGSNVTGYILSVSDENSDPVEHKKIPETRFDVENLKKNTNYTICVQAENIVGKSDKTCVHIKTLNEGKPERPANLKVTPHRGIVVVTWEIPSQDVLYYVVMYKKEGLGKWSEKNISGLKGSVKCDLENLKPGNYVVQVVAVNKYGFSQASKSKTFTVVLPTPKPPRTQRSTTAYPDPEKNESEKPKTIVIAICVSIGLLLILAVVFFALWVKRRTGRENPPTVGLVFSKGDVDFEMKRNPQTAHDFPLSDYENLSSHKRMKSNENKWELLRENIQVKKVIGKGSFGQVAKGILLTETKEGKLTEQVVAIKMTKDSCSDSDKKDLVSELEIMKCLKRHRNVIQLLGCVTKTDPLLVVIAFVPYGDLLGYLRKSRGKNDHYFNDPDIKPKTDLTSKELIRFAVDVACGMEFLALNKVVHRDLAARNVLVGEELVCKITDFGMARDIYQDNIYTKTSRGRIPVKWTAYESLMYNQYTSQSDVWSYGVLLYEIFTIGGTPYPGLKGSDVYSLLKEGRRIEKPGHVNKELYSVMLHCWETKPEERPSFTSLKKTMQKLERKHQDYVNLQEYNSWLYENLKDLELEAST